MKTTSISPSSPLSFLLIFLLSVLLFTSYRSCFGARPTSGIPERVSPLPPKRPDTGGGTGAEIVTLALNKAPRQVRELIRYLKSTKHLYPPKGHKGGRVFRNREKVLPKEKTYYEFDIYPYRPGISRGTERLVVDQKKSVFYYTKDHYGSFIQIK